MVKGLLYYYFFPLGYIIASILLDFFPIILFFPIPLFFFIACVIGLLKVSFKKNITLLQKSILLTLLCIPVLDLAFGLHSIIRNEIKGEIVFSIMDDSFAHTRSVIVREKNGTLKGEYELSAAGFGEPEEAEVTINDTSLLTIRLTKHDYTERLFYDKEQHQILEREKNLRYRIFINKLLK